MIYDIMHKITIVYFLKLRMITLVWSWLGSANLCCNYNWSALALFGTDADFLMVSHSSKSYMEDKQDKLKHLV